MLPCLLHPTCWMSHDPSVCPSTQTLLCCAAHYDGAYNHMDASEERRKRLKVLRGQTLGGSYEQPEVPHAAGTMML